jgi:ABC-type lipoprotein release transport system permease subunit
MENVTIFLNKIIAMAVSFYDSNFFSVIKFALGIYAVVILVDIVLMLVQRGLGGDIRDTLLGMNVPAELVKKKGKLRKKWDEIRKNMETENESKWKLAVIEADAIIDDLIRRMGYKGENMSERLAGINPGQIENIEELKLAHETRNRIIQEESYKLEKTKAQEAIGYYENFLRYFEVFD